MLKKCLVALLAGLCAAPLAWGASFDCKQARTRVETMVCADHALSVADERLAKTYRNALAVAPDPAALRQVQRNWILTQRDLCADPECLLQAYDNQRIYLEEFARNYGGATQVSSTAPAPAEWVHVLREDQFDAALAKYPYLLVHLSSYDANCPYCVRSNPKIDRLAEHYDGRVTVARLVWQPWYAMTSSPLMKRLHIRAVPVTLFFRHGQQVFQVWGDHEDLNDRLRRLIDPVLQADGKR